MSDVYSYERVDAGCEAPDEGRGGGVRGKRELWGVRIPESDTVTADTVLELTDGRGNDDE